MPVMSPGDEMMTSFGMPGQEQMYPPYGMGMQGMHMGLASQDPFGEMCHWGHQTQGEGENGLVAVKREPRWEEAYRQG